MLKYDRQPGGGMKIYCPKCGNKIQKEKNG
jgi:hypothetical protein